MTLEPYQPPRKPEMQPLSLAEVMARMESQRPVHPSGLFDGGALTPKGVRLRVWELMVGGMITLVLGYFCVQKQVFAGAPYAEFLKVMVASLACYGVGFCAWVGYSLSEHGEVSAAREKTGPSPWYEKMMFEMPVRRAGAAILVIGGILHVASLGILCEFVVQEVPFWQRAVAVGMGLLLVGHLWRRVRYHLLAQMMSDT